MNKFNDWVALKITLAFSTMWAFYLFIVYGLIPVFYPEYQDRVLYWSNFLQLISLPALAVGAIVIAQRQEKKNKSIFEAQEKRAQETHDAVMEELQELKEIIRILQRKAG